MQDRYRQIDETLLRRTAGPYIGSKAAFRNATSACLFLPSKRTLIRTELRQTVTVTQARFDLANIGLIDAGIVSQLFLRRLRR